MHFPRRLLSLRVVLWRLDDSFNAIWKRSCLLFLSLWVFGRLVKCKLPAGLVLFVCEMISDRWPLPRYRVVGLTWEDSILFQL